MVGTRLGKHSGLHVAMAIGATFTIAFPAATTHAQVDPHLTVSAPWIVVCERRPCVDNERVTNIFFDMIYEQSRKWTGANPYFWPAKDWNSLVELAAERHEALAARRAELAAELCIQSEKLDTPTEFGAMLERTARASRELGAAYRAELEERLSVEGRLLVDRVIHWLPDHVHVMDLDYMKYLTAASVERVDLGRVFCSLASSQALTEQDFHPDAASLSKPAFLPFAVFVAPECPVPLNDIRDSASSAISRAGMSPLQWPATKETLSLAGVYVALECDGEESAVSVLLSLIDPRRAAVDLYDGYGTGDHYGGDLASIAAPSSNSDVDRAYNSFLRDALELTVYRFLMRRFQL